VAGAKPNKESQYRTHIKPHDRADDLENGFC